MFLQTINVYLIIQNTTTIISEFERHNEKYPKLGSHNLATAIINEQMRLHINLFEVIIDSGICPCNVWDGVFAYIIIYKFEKIIVRHSSPNTFISYDIHHLRHSSLQTSDLLAKIRRSSPQTFITLDVHHPLTEFSHSSPQTFITLLQNSADHECLDDESLGDECQTIVQNYLLSAVYKTVKNAKECVICVCILTFF